MVDWLDDNSWTGTPGEMLSNLLTVNKEQSCNNNSDKDPISCEELSDPEDAQEEDLPSYFTFTVRNRSSTSFVTCGDSTNQCSSAGFSFAVKINDVTTSSIGPGQSTTVSLPYGQSYTWDLVGINLYGGARTFTVYPPNNKVVTLSQCCDVGGSSILSIDNTYYSNDRIVNDIFPFE